MIDDFDIEIQSDEFRYAEQEDIRSMFAEIIQYCDWDRIDDILTSNEISWATFKKKFARYFGSEYQAK